MNIPKQALKLINIIEANNLEVYVVGGFIRDYLLNIVSHDIDLATNGTPDQLKAILPQFKIIDTGIKHGTITVIIDTISIEITTYRIDGTYNNQRHPDNVVFTTSLKEDMARRDFTINALAYNPKAGLIDYYNGQEDLENKLIKAVGNPDQRFKEDGLRILRALRFAAQLGFQIEEKTQQAIFQNKAIIHHISAERKLSELKKLLLGRNVKSVILNYSIILDFIIPELSLMADFPLSSPYHIHNLLQHTATAVENIEPLFHLRLSMLLHDIGKIHTITTGENSIDHFYSHSKHSYEVACAIVENLQLDRSTAHKIITLVKYHDLPIKNSALWVKKWLNSLGESIFFDLIKVKKADCLAQTPSAQNKIIEIEKIENLATTIINSHECYTLKQLEIKGNDLIELGIRSGPEIGTILNEHLYLVMSGKLPNKKDSLLKHIKLSLFLH